MNDFNPLRGEYQALPRRGITEETCRKWGYQTGHTDGKPVQIANYYRNGLIIAQKLRFANKTFSVRGDGKHLPLYGSHLWDHGKNVIITEGEIDAMSVSQVQENRWPVLSVPNGAAGAEKAIRNNMEYLLRFDTVIFLFDTDEPGEAAALECAALLPPGRAKIAHLAHKDANAALQAGRGQDILQAYYNAKTYRPDGILIGNDLEVYLDQEIEWGLSYPWPTLTQYTYGIRHHEIYTLLAGSGMGKTELLKEISYHLISNHKVPCGVLFLEEVPRHTVQCYVGKALDRRIYLPNVEVEPDERQAAFKAVFGDDLLYVYDHKGCSDFEVIREKIRFMVHQGVQFVFLDHITALAEGKGEDNVNGRLHEIMEELNKLVQELPFSIFLISHIRKAHGRKAAEEGGRITADDAYGSGAIKQRSNFIFSLERDQQAEGSERDLSTLRVLKDRFSGSSVGKTLFLQWGETTGRLTETTDVPFGE
jgi:twinkle protein